METNSKPRSPEQLARDLQLLQSKIQTLKLAQLRIEKEAMHLADAIKVPSNQGAGGGSNLQS